MGEVMIYCKLEECSCVFVVYFQEGLGLQKGDCVVLMMFNLLQYLVVLFGILCVGMIVVNVNFLYILCELEYQFNDSGVVVIVIVFNFVYILEKVVVKIQVQYVILMCMGDQFFIVKGMLVNFVVKYIKCLVLKYYLLDVILFCSVLQYGYCMQYVKLEIVVEDLVFLQYIGGIIGVVKGVMLIYCNMLVNFEQVNVIYGLLLYCGKEFVVIVLLLYYIFVLIMNCLLFIELGG